MKFICNIYICNNIYILQYIYIIHVYYFPSHHYQWLCQFLHHVKKTWILSFWYAYVSIFDIVTICNLALCPKGEYADRPSRPPAQKWTIFLWKMRNVLKRKKNNVSDFSYYYFSSYSHFLVILWRHHPNFRWIFDDNSKNKNRRIFLLFLSY